MAYLIDAHHLGARQTGNETWIRNVIDHLVGMLAPGQLAVCVAHSGAALPVGVTTRNVSGSALRRLAFDIPRLAHGCDAEAILVQYTMPLTPRPCAVMIHDLASFDPDGPRWLGRAHAMRIRSSINNSVRRAKVLLAPSAFTQRRIAERYSLDPGSILIAPNAVDPKLAQLIDNASPLTRPARSRVLAVGNVLPRKNLEMLAQAIGLLRSQGINLELRVVGQVGSDGAAIRAELERRLGDAVSFSGYVTPEGLASEYRSGDLLAFPSLHEGFGIPALEAMYAGLPVIASSAAGLREVVDGAGIVIPPDDPALWADRIGHVLSDDATAAELVERGRRRAAEVTWRESAEAVCTALLIASGQAADAGSAA